MVLCVNCLVSVFPNVYVNSWYGSCYFILASGNKKVTDKSRERTVRETMGRESSEIWYDRVEGRKFLVGVIGMF